MWIKIMVSNNFMEIRMGEGVFECEKEEGRLKQFWNSRWKGGGRVKKTRPSVMGVWIFSRITHCYEYKTSFFLLWRQLHKLFCPFNVKLHGLSTEDAILIFEARGIGSNCPPQRLNLHLLKSGSESTSIFQSFPCRIFGVITTPSVTSCTEVQK